jgi:hypothetical protein
MFYRFSEVELVASRARYAQPRAERVVSPALAPTTPPSAPAPGFVYCERSASLWNRRAHQSYKSSFGVTVEPDPEIADGDEASGKNPKAKAVTAASLCECTHRHDLHNLTLPTPPLKPSPAIGAYSLITAPCEARVWDGQEWKPCGCLNYVDAETKKPAALKRPKAEDWTLCARCGLRKDHHCIKGRAGFRIGDIPYICSHFDRELNPVNYVCTNGRCAAVDATGNFVNCSRFVNPWLTPKKRVASGKTRNRKRVAASPEVAATLGTPESVLAGEPVKPSRTRKKKSTAFTTGENLFPPETATETQTIT